MIAVNPVRQAVPVESALMSSENTSAQQAWDRYERSRQVQIQLSRKYQEMRTNGNGLYEGKQFRLPLENNNLKTGGNT